MNQIGARLVLLLLGFGVGLAIGQEFSANCTEDQVQEIVSINAKSLRSSDCAEVDFTSMSSLCSAADCIYSMWALADELPDCIYRGINYSESSELTLVWACSTYENVFGSLSADASTSDESALPTASPAGSSCSSDELDMVVKITSKLIDNDECAGVDFTEFIIPSASGSSWGSWTLAWCLDSQCVNYWAEQVSQLPDCSIHGINYRDTLSIGVTSCGATISDSVVGSESASPSEDSSGSFSAFGESVAARGTLSLWAACLALVVLSF